MFNLLKFETKENHILALHTYHLNCLQYLKGLKLRFSEKATKFENLSEICLHDCIIFLNPDTYPESLILDLLRFLSDDFLLVFTSLVQTELTYL